MKTLSKLLLVSALGIWGLNTASAQTAPKYDRALKRIEVSNLVDNKDYVFEANNVDTKKGAMPLKYHKFDVALSKDTLVACLPTKSGNNLELSSTSYTYNEWKNKAGDRIVVIDPAANSANIKEIRMDITPTGHTSVSVRTAHGPLALDGYIKQEDY
jgi:Domain of unknown function (DUF4251)